MTRSPARNRIGPSQVRSAFGLVRTGEVYDLGTELSRRMPVGSPDIFSGFQMTPYRTPRRLVDAEHAGFDFATEVISGSLHLGTHIDGFAHIQSDGLLFGEVPVEAAYDDFGWREHGMETVPPLIGRGVLLDLPQAKGLDRLPDGYEITPDDVQECCAAQETELRQGDAVLVRTGKFLDYHWQPEHYFSPSPGVTRDAAVYLYELGMALLGSDTSTTEPFPLVDTERTTHAAMLVERGVHLVEIMNLEQLADDAVYEFLLICLPLKIVGASGSWVRPVAVV
jgi:kynurenine formamidase